MKVLNKTPENNVIPSGVISLTARQTSFSWAQCVITVVLNSEACSDKHVSVDSNVLKHPSAEPVGSRFICKSESNSSGLCVMAKVLLPVLALWKTSRVTRVLLSCHLQPAECYVCTESRANIIHDRGEAVCSTSSASIFNDVDCPGKEKQIRTQRRQRAVLRLPCRWQQ